MKQARESRKGGEDHRTSASAAIAEHHLGAGAAVIVFALALALRLSHLWQIGATPFATVLMGDGRAYDRWAQAIASGDVIGREVFYQAPLYAYFLGAIYSLAGHDVTLARVCQAAVGALACVLLGATAARLFSRRAGIIAGVALGVYAPAIFFDGLIQKSVLDVFFVS